MPDEIAHDAQVTSAHVLEVIQQQVIPRLDTLEGKVDGLEAITKDAGLNGHTPLLKAFLEQYGATYETRQAWQTVRSDIAHRLRWVAPGRHWLTVLFASIVGAIGWQIVSHFSGVNLPALP